VVGDIIGLPFLGAVLIAMIREDESDARVIDAELDAGAAEIAGSSAARPNSQPAAAERPWWHDDPRFTGRFAPVDPDAGASGSQPR
jgi:hypothetical protein